MKDKVLKEDGSLNVEYINNLPYEKYISVIGSLTQEQVKEYNSKLTLNESNEPISPVSVDKRRGIDASKFLNEMREKYIVKR